MEIHRPACVLRVHSTFLCTADTVAYLFFDWNVKSDLYLPENTPAIRTAIALGEIIDFDSIFSRFGRLALSFPL